MVDDGTLDAGELVAWHERMLRALDGEVDADVPCGECTACCEAGQFVHIGPDETDALAAVPAELRFPAPGRPGHVVVPYDEHGRCPMLGERGCTIYERRPRTCRTYDCRVFAATGVEPESPAIAARVQRWRFDLSAPGSHRRLDELHAAAERLAAGAARPTEVAVRAVQRRPTR